MRYIATTQPVNRALEYGRRETVVWDRQEQRVVHTYRKGSSSTCFRLASAMAEKLNAGRS